MSRENILFFNEGVTSVLRDRTKIRRWLTRCARKKNRSIGSITYVFCNDRYLRKINRRFLGHDYNTDIITFPSMEPRSNRVSGEMYISVDRVRANAAEYDVTIKDELHRVMVHGLLHLCGEKDKTRNEAIRMRQEEDRMIGLLKDSN
jgi:rRNA maturation RNase YbeY